MLKLCIFVSTTVFGYIGWYIGLEFGEITTAFLVSSALTIFGVWFAWWFNRKFFE